MGAQLKRATVYLEQPLHRALRLKAAETDRSVSEIVNDAIRQALSEDAEDILAFEKRSREPRFRLEDVLKDMKKRGQL
ncbi:MAG TPA: ribbon-helix-helix protein, CopG family [Terriglobia bacterium]|nr:ribbon-helix-helix protein, CopG family [Terriglobia bacterium]